MEDFVITGVKGRWVLDSRGNPTVEAEVFVGDVVGKAIVPSGASRGKREVLELRDKGKAFHGRGVDKAVNAINKIIAPAIKNMDVREQKAIDEKLIQLDGTEKKEKLGGNSLLAVSLACARAASLCLHVPLYDYLGDEKILPVPFMNVINGGEHAGNELTIQEHMICPIGALNFRQAVQMCSEVYHTLKEIIKKKYGRQGINVGDEGGFAPPMKDSEEALEIILHAIEENGYGDEMKLALDCAASSFFEDGRYKMEKLLTSDELLDFYVNLTKEYPIISIEDPFAEDDWHGFVEITKKMGKKLQIVGDDIFVTNIKRVKEGMERGACNAMLLKPNQIGTLTESIEVAKYCQKNNYGIMVSHRSGDTCDSFIADLAVALGAGQIKAGAPCRAERTEKYNRLLRIEEELGKAKYGK